jgi:hypothetical protein
MGKHGMHLGLTQILLSFHVRGVPRQSSMASWKPLVILLNSPLPLAWGVQGGSKLQAHSR